MEIKLKTFLIYGYVICFFSFLSLQAFAQINVPQVWSMAIVGGDNIKGEMPDFFLETKAFVSVMEDFTPESFSLFHGNSTNGLIHKEMKTEGLAEKYQVFKENLINLNSSCTMEDLSFINETFSSYINDPKNFDLVYYSIDDLQNEDLLGPLAKYYSGPAKRLEVKNYFTKTLENIPPNSHFLLHLSDHGLKRSNENWIVSLGEASEYLSTKDLKIITSSFQNKGITFHLNTLSCYSGGFVKELTSSYSLPVCAIASSSRNRMSYSSHPEIDPFFATVSYDHHLQKELLKYQNQLQAHSCAAAKDFINHPNTSLDFLVLSKDFLPNLPKPNDDLNSLRQILKNAYKEYVQDVVSECRQEVDENALRIDLDFLSASTQCYKARCTDQKMSYLKKNILQAAYIYDDTCKSCYSQACDALETCNTFTNDCEIKLKICEEEQSRCLTTYNQACSMIQDFSYSSDYYICYMMEEINKFLSQDSAIVQRNYLDLMHERFLDYASKSELEEYKNLFCCLSFDFKERTRPALCDSY